MEFNKNKDKDKKIKSIVSDFNEGKIDMFNALTELNKINSKDSRLEMLDIKVEHLFRNTVKNNDKKITTLDVIAWRDDIEKLINDIRQYPQNRFTSLVITKLEEAQMWAGNLFSKDVTDTFNIKRVNNMEEFEKRLIEEKDDLEKKVARLLVFVKSGKFKSLPEEDQFLLNIQSNSMLNYLSTLEQRIKRLDL